MKAKSRKPIPIIAPKLKSLKRARKVTSDFHRITHAIAKLEESKNKSKLLKNKIVELNKELENMGGREVYQQASVLTTARCSSTKWVIKILRKRNILTIKKSLKDPRVLEVGAINVELLSTSGLNVHAIDILSRDPRIEQRDFFSYEKEIKLSNFVPYDAIVCSMVINCVPNYLDRGKMLLMIYEMIQPGGLLFLTLPRSCLTPPNVKIDSCSLSSLQHPKHKKQQNTFQSKNDKAYSDNESDCRDTGQQHSVGQKAGAHYGFDHKVFESICENIGFAMVQNDSKMTDKVFFYCFQKQLIPDTKKMNVTKKSLNQNTSKKVSGFFVALPHSY